MTDSAYELPPTETPDAKPHLVLVTDTASHTGGEPDQVSVFDRAIFHPTVPPLSLTETDMTSFRRMERERLPVHAVTTFLLRAAGFTTDLTAVERLQQTEADLVKPASTVAKQLKENTRLQDAAIQRLRAAQRTEGDSPAKLQRIAKARATLQRLKDRVPGIEQESQPARAAVAAARENAAPYLSVAAEVTGYNERYKTVFYANNRPDLDKISRLILDPVEELDLQHPAIDVAEDARRRMGTRGELIIVPERILYMILLDKLADKQSDG